MAPSFSLENLHESIATRFDEAQNTLVNHRKNCVGLYNTHIQASKVSNEDAFADVFISLMSRVMDVKKGSGPDRILKFVGSYVKFIHDKVSEAQKPASTSKNQIDDPDDTLASRFVSRLLEWLLRGFEAKNKAVRLRAVSLVTEITVHIGEMDDDMYDALKDSLTDRIHDKEPSIRAQAVVGLSKLIGTEDVTELKKGDRTILQMVLDLMCYDTAAEVRRAALVSVPLNPESLKAILTRTHDVDTLTRKLAYSSVLAAKLHHPRQLTISQREEIIKAGLGDREPAVRAAVGKVLEGWIDIALSEVKDLDNQFTWSGDDGGVMKAFIHFLSWFDVVGPGGAVAVDAILSIFTTRTGICDSFIFQEEFWKELTAESSILARTFVEHCLGTNNQNTLEAASLPVVTAFAVLIQDAYNALLQVLHETELLGGGDDDEEAEAREEDLAKKEVILGELLRMALKLDYMDEIGRRKVFSVVKEMLAQPHLPTGLIPPTLDLLKEIVPSERDLIRIVVEMIIDLREGDDNVEEPLEENDISQSEIAKKERSMRRAKQSHEMSDEEKKEADLTDIRCLTLCIGMLERVNGSFEDNSTLEGMLTDLIIPAVKRKEIAMREKGLVALGLCCLIAKNMALNSFQLFFNQVQTAPEDLMLKVLQVIFDLLVMYEHEFLGRSQDVADGIITFILQVLEAAESDRVQAVLSIGLSKLLLCGLITDPKVLTNLVITYVSPSTSKNTELKQCLSYFFPVYCYSSAENQDRMRNIFLSAYDLATSLHDELDDDQEMITPLQFGQVLVDWTSPAKASYKTAAQSQSHCALCIDLLIALFDSDRTDQKILCQIIDQLHLTADWNAQSVIKISVLLDNLDQQKPYDDPAAEKVLNKFKIRFSKLFSPQLDEVDLRQYVDDSFREIYEAIGVDVPDPNTEQPQRVRIPFSDRTLNSEAGANSSHATNISHQGDNESVVSADTTSKPHPVTPMKKAGKRRARTPAATRAASPPRKKRNQTKSSKSSKKKAPTPDLDSETERDDSEDEVAALIQAEPQPTRRSARTPHRKVVQYVESSGDDDEDEESDASIPVQRKGRKKKVDSDE